MSYLARNEKQIGNIIRRIRKKKGFSQAAIGEKCGLRQGTISVLESGNPAIKMKTFLSVLAALDLELKIQPREKGLDIEDLF